MKTKEEILNNKLSTFFDKNKTARFDDVPHSVFYEAMEEYANHKTTPVENRVSLRAVFEKIVNIVNEGKRFVVTQDFGDNTLTIEIDGKHTHCGSPGGTFEQLIDSLDDTLNKQKGLSWR